MGGRGFRGDGGGEGRFGRGGGGGRIGPGGGRDRGGGGGGRNMVWMREAEDGGQISSNVDPRHGGSDKSRWEAAAMEVQGGTRGEKWGRQQHPEGHASGRQLEEFFNSYINTNWRCSARSIGPNTFVMRFPSPRDVDKACFAERVLNVAWVNVSNIPLDKRHEKNIAYVGSLVGVTLEIDKATINRPESVRIKLGCRDAEDIPASAEGVLGGHFYDFFYSVDKILIKNPPKERIGIQHENEEGNAAKKARFNTETPGKKYCIII
ncbi:hypothetical protein D1007_09898 [Hordeum vulgare]|nr:hypothetical protein D1007_09898 [Hordeum vulgare]